MPLLPPSRFAELHREVAAATQPLTGLERWFAGEIAHATWELERVRANNAHAAAEPRLHDAHSRATRNWNRARNGLAILQTARINHVIRLTPSRQKEAAATPLADPAHTRAPKLAGPMYEHVCDLIKAGKFDDEIMKTIAEQEKR